MITVGIRLVPAVACCWKFTSCFGKDERGLVEQLIQSILFTICSPSLVLGFFFPPVIWGNLYSVNKRFNIWNYLKNLCSFWPLSAYQTPTHKYTAPLWRLSRQTLKNQEISRLAVFVTSSFPLVMGGSYGNLKICVLLLFLHRIWLPCAVHKLYSTNLLRKYSIFDFFLIIQGIVPWFIHYVQFKSIFISVLVFSTTESESSVNTNECIFALCWNEVVSNPF